MINNAGPVNNNFHQTRLYEERRTCEGVEFEGETHKTVSKLTNFGG
jgi:hypothetical protein